MSKVTRLRAADWHAIAQLSHECRDLGDSATHWQSHFVAVLSRLIGADMAVGGELAGFSIGLPQILSTPVEVGFNQGLNRKGWDRAMELIQTDPTYSHALGSYTRSLAMLTGTALRRSELIGGSEWDGSVERREVFEVVGVDHGVYCFPALIGTPDQVFGGVFTRAIRRRDFTSRETGIIREATVMVSKLVGRQLARFTEPSPAELAPRVRQVLKCVLEGDSTKQIASRLQISVHTVNQYMKAIFDHFGTQGRAELLARWVVRGWGGRCSWSEIDESK